MKDGSLKRVIVTQNYQALKAKSPTSEFGPDKVRQMLCTNIKFYNMT